MSDGPLFTALATSTKHLHLLLRTIAFTNTATVHITPDGLRVATEEAHAIQASTLLDKSLFSSYILQTLPDDEGVPPFKINVVALLETLQIFGISEGNAAYKSGNGGFSSTYAAAFTTPALGLGGTCKITYAEPGAPLSIAIEESGVRTTCQMNTYSISNMYDEDFEIPLDRDGLVLKTIMPSVWLHDAISELASTNSETIAINVSSTSTPLFLLEGHGGPFGDCTVAYNADNKGEDMVTNRVRGKQPQITETFVVRAPAGSRGRVRQRYKFDFIKKAGRAMAAASKVSVRLDRQGVLSLQFLVEESPGLNNGVNDGSLNLNSRSGHSSFIDFRFVPLLDESDDEGEGEDASDQEARSSAGSGDEADS